MAVSVVEITNELNDFRPRIETFLAILESELEFLDPGLDTSKVMASELVIVALDEEGEIVGLNGTVRRFGINKHYLVIRADHQGMGLGKRLFRLNYEAAKGGSAYNLLLGVADIRNIRSINLCTSNGYRVIGRRWNLIYMLKPLNALGFFLYVAFRSVFPFLKILDRIQGDGS